MIFRSVQKGDYKEKGYPGFPKQYGVRFLLQVNLNVKFNLVHPNVSAFSHIRCLKSGLPHWLVSSKELLIRTRGLTLLSIALTLDMFLLVSVQFWFLLLVERKMIWIDFQTWHKIKVSWRPNKERTLSCMPLYFLPKIIPKTAWFQKDSCCVKERSSIGSSNGLV